jgi:hypothetical protein
VPLLHPPKRQLPSHNRSDNLHHPIHLPRPS